MPAVEERKLRRPLEPCEQQRQEPDCSEVDEREGQLHPAHAVRVQAVEPEEEPLRNGRVGRPRLVAVQMAVDLLVTERREGWIARRVTGKG